VLGLRGWANWDGDRMVHRIKVRNGGSEWREIRIEISPMSLHLCDKVKLIVAVAYSYVFTCWKRDSEVCSIKSRLTTPPNERVVRLAGCIYRDLILQSKDEKRGSTLMDSSKPQPDVELTLVG
jgi:hypothetical protein